MTAPSDPTPRRLLMTAENLFEEVRERVTLGDADLLGAMTMAAELREALVVMVERAARN